MLHHAELLADYCRCTVEEIAQLIGFCRRAGGDGLHWYLAGQWVSKECFVSSRSAAVCSLCLQEAGFIRGLWDLTFYVACPVHGVKLITTCASCGQKIAWNRREVLKCNCGYDLRLLPNQAAHPSAMLLSSIIEKSIDATARINAIPADNLITTRRLAELSLDGLFKTIWFLGKVLPAVLTGISIRGREKPTRDAALDIVIRAFSCLSAWPHSFVGTLDELAKRPTSTSSAALLDRLFGSVHRYLVVELDRPETAFLRTAYEQQIRQIWRRAGRRHPLRTVNRQLELDLGLD